MVDSSIPPTTEYSSFPSNPISIIDQQQNHAVDADDGQRYWYLLHISMYSVFFRDEAHRKFAWAMAIRPNFLRDYNYVSGGGGGRGRGRVGAHGFGSDNDDDDDGFFIGLDDWKIFIRSVDMARVCTRFFGKLLYLFVLLVTMNIVLFILVIFTDGNVIARVASIVIIVISFFIQHDACDELCHHCYYHRQIENSIESLQQRIQIREEEKYIRQKRRQTSNKQQQEENNNKNNTNNQIIKQEQSYQPKVIISLIVKREIPNIWWGLVPAHRSYLEFFIPSERSSSQTTTQEAMAMPMTDIV